MKRFLIPILLMASFSASASVNVDLREVSNIYCSDLLNLNPVFNMYEVNSENPRIQGSVVTPIKVKSVTKNSITFVQHSETYHLVLKRVAKTYKGMMILSEYRYSKGVPSTLACSVQ